YRVAAVFRRELFSRRIDPNQVGFPVRHVAINTVVHHSRAEPGRNFTLAGLMTRKAFLSELNQVPLLLMDVVAGRAGHRRAGAKAFALAQQRNLIPVNVRCRIGFAPSGGGSFIQPLSRFILERRLLGVPRARMAQSAIIQLPVARKARWVENILSLLLGRVS